MLHKIKRFALAVGASSLMFAPIAVRADSSTVTVTPSNTNGWGFNVQAPFVTPYEFNEDASSTGEGSLYVQPIANTLPQNKFIAAKTVGALTSDVESVSFDFQLSDGVDSAQAKQFYLNVYTNTVGSSTFYECRFDYAAVTGSDSAFTTLLATADTVATDVADRADAFTCPDTWSEMPAGSTVSFVSINVGDTSNSDAGVGGYLDNAVFTTTTDTVAYDFEQDPTVLTDKDDCKNGGWADSELPVFKNQGDCVSYFASKGKAKGNPVTSLLRRMF